MDFDYFKRFLRSRSFQDQLSIQKELQNPWSISCTDVWIHDWKPLFQTLRQHNVPISSLALGYKDVDPTGFCSFTKRGAETLGWVLNPKKSGLSIENFFLHSCQTSRSIHNKWMHGMMPCKDEERLFIYELRLQNATSWLLPNLVLRNCKIQNVICESAVGDDDVGMISLCMKMRNPENDIDETADEFFEEAKFGLLAKKRASIIHTMEIELGKDTTPAAFQSLGVMLCSSYLRTLVVKFAGVRRDIDYNLLFKGARRCGQIVIRDSPDKNDNDLFPCDGLNFLMGSSSGASLEHLTFWPNENPSKGERYAGLGRLLKKTDLSSLKTFHVDTISISDGAFSALCHQLEENKGPQQLWITIDKYRYYDRKKYKNDNEALKKLGKSLRGNDKIKELNISFINLNLTAMVFLRFIQIVFEDMPVLKSFELQTVKNYEQLCGGEKCSDDDDGKDEDDDDDQEDEDDYEDEDEYEEDDDDDEYDDDDDEYEEEDDEYEEEDDEYDDDDEYEDEDYEDEDDDEDALEISSNVEMKKMILQLISKSKTITHVSLPFHDEGLGFLMEGVAKFRPLLLPCGKNAVPDGIWSHALDCTNIVIPDVMFYVLQRMPSLLQRNAGNDDNLLPMFMVPHHRNCPACRREDGDGKVCVLQGRYCGKRFVYGSQGKNALK